MGDTVEVRLHDWCERWLGAAPARVLFEKGHLSRVVGVELPDRRRIVVKVRPCSERLAGCVEVQRRLSLQGFPCPEPVAGPAPYGSGSRCATAETLIPGGTELGGDADPARPFAELLARLVRLAPRPDELPALEPPPPWVGWDHNEPGIWPRPDDLDTDLNAGRDQDWIDELGRRLRARLCAATGAVVVGHADWESHNVRWRGPSRSPSPLAVDDWDSVASRVEPAIAGAAAAVFPSSADGRTVAATIPQTAAFLRAYQAALGRRWSADDQEICWAAGLWVLTYNARKETFGGGAGYLRHLDREAEERLRRAGA